MGCWGLYLFQVALPDVLKLGYFSPTMHYKKGPRSKQIPRAVNGVQQIDYQWEQLSTSDG